MDDEVLQQALCADTDRKGWNTRERFRAGIERRGMQAGIGHGHDRLLVANSGFEYRRGFGSIRRVGHGFGGGLDFMGLHD